MDVMRRGRSLGWALLLAASLAALLASTTGASPQPHPLSDAPWGANVEVDDDPGTTSQRSPTIAVDRHGNAYTVWQDDRSGNHDIYFSYRPAGGSWQANVMVNGGGTAGAAAQESPAIAVDQSGNAYAVWQDFRNGNNDIYFSYRPAGGNWQANVMVNDGGTAGTADQETPAIAVDPNGNAYVVWQDYRNGNNDIYFSYRPAGGNWQANVMVNDGGTAGAADQGSPAIAVDPSGNAFAAWQDYRNGNNDVYFSYRPAGGSWQADVMVNDGGAAGAADQGSPSIAVDPNGNAFAVWLDSRNWPNEVYFSYRPAGDSWQADVRVNDIGTRLSGAGPSIAVDPCGNAFVVWAGLKFIVPWPPFVYSTLESDYRPAGGSWGTDVSVSIQTVGRPDVAVDVNGNAYAVFDHFPGAVGPDPGPHDPESIYFSYRPSQVSVRLGDLVWSDTDGDGLQDPGEPGLEGVSATLYQNGSCTAPSLATRATDANGNYLFACLPACTYCLEFTTPGGWGITRWNQGSDDIVDSDANPATGRIQNILMLEGTDDLDEDVGLLYEEFVPEWGTLALLGSGFAGLAGYATLKRRGRE